MQTTMRTWLAMLAIAGLMALPVLAGCPPEDDDDDDAGDDDAGDDDAGDDDAGDDDTGDDDTGDDDTSADICAEYPPEDNNFEVGSVIRNYTFWDVDDVEHQICEYGGGGQQLILLILSATW